MLNVVAGAIRSLGTVEQKLCKIHPCLAGGHEKIHCDFIIYRELSTADSKHRAQSGNQRNHLLGPAALPPEHVVSSFTLNESASVLELQRAAERKGK